MWFFGIIAVLVLVAALWYARQAYLAWSTDDTIPPTGFTLGDLRALRKKGQLTDSEFEVAKEKILNAAKRPPKAPPIPGGLQGFQAKGVGFTGGFPVQSNDDRDPKGQAPQSPP